MTQTTVRYFVTDVDEAIDFYCNRLGFHVDLPRAPGFARLARDDLRLLLHEPGVGGAGKAGGVPKPGGWNRFQVVVDDLDATVERLAAHGASFRGETVELFPAEESVGTRYAGAARPSRITERTWSTDGASHGNSTSHQVAPAAA